MDAIKKYPRVESVEPTSGKRLLVRFAGGVSKVYDCTPLLEDPPFRPLEDEALFRCVKADPHGYGVVWNDDIGLAESELWEEGRQADTAEAAGPRR
ncbi:MAG: DUF2442 domain-containing protein [Planctomycetota bacterium]|jgi:hypothetical protein